MMEWLVLNQKKWEKDQSYALKEKKILVWGGVEVGRTNKSSCNDHGHPVSEQNNSMEYLIPT